ncbi:hypothetical protein B4109_2580 [Geobacillus stearothermophilus]|uniref:Uncharacterized protein n=1 Tax=Geobacillus stearothermophilus TaxID=1422 RepID=A0A150MX65_GEOSE|nr:hypothetical protein B4109_2580 [Geobacillus stearothermophilus]
MSTSRSAIRQLEAEGLVEFKPYTGAVVSNNFFEGKYRSVDHA